MGNTGQIKDNIIQLCGVVLFIIGAHSLVRCELVYSIMVVCHAEEAEVSLAEGARTEGCRAHLHGMVVGSVGTADIGSVRHDCGVPGQEGDVKPQLPSNVRGPIRRRLGQQEQ